MPEIAADLHLACSGLLPETGIQEFQSLGPDPIPPRACARARDAARDANGRFAKGYSGNPKGRPRGIRNPRRRPLELLLRQARPGTLAPLVRRKRYLRLPVLRLVLPPAREPDPGERLGIDFSRMRSAAEIAAAMSNLFAAIGRGEIAPSEGLRLARRARKPLRGTRRELWRDLARLEATRRGARRGGEFPVKAPKIPCSEGISAEAAPEPSSRGPAEAPAPGCSTLLSATGIEPYQRVRPDLFPPCAGAREGPRRAPRQAVRLARRADYSRLIQGTGIGASTWRGLRSAGFSTRPIPLRRSARAGPISSAPTPGPGS